MLVAYCPQCGEVGLQPTRAVWPRDIPPIQVKLRWCPRCHQYVLVVFHDDRERRLEV